MSTEEKSLEQQAYDNFYIHAQHIGDKESLRDLAIDYAKALKKIADNREYTECVRLLGKGVGRFAQELARFDIVINQDLIQAEYERPININSKPELFVHYRGLMFASINPDSLHVVGATVAVQKICLYCTKPFYKSIREDRDWLYEMGVFLASNDPCYICQVKGV